MLLDILVLAAVPDAITNVFTSVLRVRGQLRQAALLNLGMAATAVSLAWWLLPGMGVVGGGLAWMLAQAPAAGVVLWSLGARHAWPRAWRGVLALARMPLRA